MKKLKDLRAQYPEFFYESCSVERRGKNLVFSFAFSAPPDIRFHPEVLVENVPGDAVTEEALWNLAFHLGLAEIPSYWKATCSPRIVISAGALNGRQTAWWKNLILEGMGQYFFENGIDCTGRGFLKITAAGKRKGTPYGKRLAKRTLIPVGGGKDAAVTLELLKEGRGFVLNPGAEQKAVLRIAGRKNPVVVRRTIDPRLLELNREGYLNGHTPFSAYLAFLSVLCAVLFDYKYIALSNERSSNEGNVEYLGREINHQYSKTFSFEKKFRTYAKEYLAKDSEYFSFLRPLYELQIAKLFASYPKYFSAFLSCNEAGKTYSGTKTPAHAWCGKCSKCLFVFAALYPFVEEKLLIQAFGKNLFEDKELVPLMEQLVGERGYKPFECVGTTKESLAAFFLSLQKQEGGLPILLSHFQKRILPNHTALARDASRILAAWNGQHALPPQFERLLKRALEAH